MNQTGHYGINLTIGGTCLLAFVFLNRPISGAIAFVTIASVAQLPDIDHHAYNVPLIKHRGWTHTIYFATGLGVCAAVGGALFTQYFASFTPITSPLFFPPNYVGGLILIFSTSVTVGILGHLAGDMITPAGIAPFNPVLPRSPITALPTNSWSLNLTTAANPTANILLGLLGAAITAVALYITIPEVIATV